MIPMPIHRRGISIIELIVVIGVVMVLLGIFLPTLSGARASALQIQQVSNIRQIGTAIDLYLGDWDGTYPIADTRPDWHPLGVDRDTALQLGIGKSWTEALVASELLTSQQLSTLYDDSHIFASVAMYTNPDDMRPDTIPVWENHHNSAVKQHWATYPSRKGLLGVSFVPSDGSDDRLASGHRLWNTGLPDGPLAPVFFADSSATRLRYSDLARPEPAPIDVWGSPVMYTWHGIRGIDK